MTPSVAIDVPEIKIPEFLELSDPYFYEAKEIHALLNADIFCRMIKDNVYKRFSRVIVGVNSSPVLIAATIKYRIEKYNEIHPITEKHLDSFMYVDDWITGQDTREEPLFMSHHAKNIVKEAGMEMRKWTSYVTDLMAQWAVEGFETYPMDASFS
ncbi:uncharacterized protein TNCV_4949281 [Trichonephila clavipes]|nr:uncharacterized protein TNCV_4949281 [Trichonephila clavipes]